VLKFSTYSVRQTLIKVHQYSLIKWSIQGNTLNWIILENLPQLTSQRNTEYGLHLCSNMYIYVYSLKIVYISTYKNKSLHNWNPF